jgi:hypothetical protein
MGIKEDCGEEFIFGEGSRDIVTAWWRECLFPTSSSRRRVADDVVVFLQYVSSRNSPSPKNSVVSSKSEILMLKIE